VTADAAADVDVVVEDDVVVVKLVVDVDLVVSGGRLAVDVLRRGCGPGTELVMWRGWSGVIDASGSPL